MKTTKATLLPFLGLLAASPALASSSHFFELQFDAPELAQIVRARLMTSGQFCPIDIPCPGGSGGQCVVDHIEYPGTAFMSQGPAGAVQINDDLTLNAPRPRLSIPILAHVQTLTCAYDPNCTTPTQTYFTTLDLAVHVGSGDQLCFTPDGLGVPVPVPMPTEQFCVDLDVSAMQAVTGAGAGAVSGRAVALNQGGSRLAARFELGVPPELYDSTRVNAWQSFVNGALAPGVNSLSWSSFVHRTLLEDSLTRRLVNGAAGAPELALDAVPTTVWTGLGASGGRLDSTVGAEYDGCVDISPLTVQAFLQKNAANTGFDLFGSVGWDADTWDTMWCGFQQAGPFGAIAGPIIASTVDLSDVGGIGGGCVVNSESGFVCSETTHPVVLTLGGGWTLQIELSHLEGLSQGLVIGGPTHFNGPDLPHLDVTLQTPSFGFRGSCSSGRCGYEGAVFLTGTARLCGPVQFLGDTLGAYSVTPPDSLTLPTVYKVGFGSLSASDRALFEANPYGPVVVVRSSVGIQTYRMDPPQLQDSVQSEQLWCLGAQVKYEAQRCMYPKWKPWEQRFHPEWVIDPWDRVAVAIDDYTRLDLGHVFVEDIGLYEIWDSRGAYVIGVGVEGRAHVGLEGVAAGTQAVDVRLGLPRGVRARTLSSALEQGFRKGVSTSVAVDRSMLPRGTRSASFGLELDLETLLEMAAGRR